ncbi:MAG: 16S rRNA (uracil(1498)-N(3))-methyltransferase [Gemmatimonadetes bacterium]|nr:16S rRNA (uracil(1498)-N(3))-methyltransferase [Gemmatimonadota bacterium]
MDRSSRASVATFYAPGAWERRVALDEAAAHHATVRRLAVGDVVRLTSGDGRRAHGHIESVSKRELVIECDVSTTDLVRARPYVELWAPVGDRDRMLFLAEKSVELGVSAWRSVIYRRSRSVNPRGEGAAFTQKLRARMVSALEQSGDAWLPQILPECDATVAIPPVATGGAILLDERGLPMPDILASAHAPVVLALGPEGGLEPEEREAFEDGGWRGASLGTNVLRFETAAIAALALTRALLKTT